ncbi:MAG TPA: DUF4157 domain-containing protein [Solirubrobacteraceae bacterium]|nr:DUF4157 domain-containing protein [Solirubrobacteraceae bacterium]
MQHVAQLAGETKAARTAAPAPRPRRPSPAAALQQRLGNRGVQRALAGGLPVAGARDPAELEAQRIASQVARPGRCACGGIAPAGGECAACRAKRLSVQRSGGGAAPAAAPPIVEQAVQEPGRSLEPGTRSSMEAHLGHDLAGVRVHEGATAAAAARALSADAFTVGSDVVFGSGAYRPGTAAGRELLAHELVHVVQQGIGVARQPRAGAKDEIATYGAFQKEVFDRATVRLDQNVVRLTEWRAFIDREFSALGLRAQAGAVEAERLYERAKEGGKGAIFEHWAGTRSPASRMLDENVINQKINGGCQYCHESGVVWQWNAKHQREFRDLPTTAQRLTLFADQAEFDRVMSGARPTLRPLTELTPAPAAGAGQAAPSGLVQPPPVPAALVYPARRSSLCGPMPSANQQRPAAFDPKMWGSNTAAAMQAVRRIGPVLEPLGPTGYQVLPDGIFSTLYNRSPQQLQDDVRRNIGIRQGKYQWLKQLIAAGKLDYYELCPIVEELLPGAAQNVRFQVVYEIEREKLKQKIIDTILAIVGAAMMLLAPIFPPAAILGVGLATGAASIYTGARDFREGSIVELGIGAGVFAPEKEAAATQLRAGGLVSMASGALGVVTSGFGVAGVMRTRFTAPRGLGDGKFRLQPDGSYVAAHPQNPNWIVHVKGNRMTAGVKVGDDFFELATAPTPWGPGPPPNTPTAAQWTVTAGAKTPPKTPPSTTALAKRPATPPPPPKTALARNRPPGLRVLAEGPGRGKHRLQLLSDGSVGRCSAHCPLLLDQFADELSHRTDLRDDLLEIQRSYPEHVADHGKPFADAWALNEANAVEFRLERVRAERAQERVWERATAHTRKRGEPSPASWALRRENVPVPTHYERTMVQRYERALTEMHAGRMAGRGERVKRAVNEMNAIEARAADPAYAEGVYLDAHVAILRAVRRRILEGSPASWAPVEVHGVAVEVVGLNVRELARFTQGAIPVPLTSRLPPMAGMSYTQLERLLGRPQQYHPTRFRITWHLGDGSMVHLDTIGPGVHAIQRYALNRQPHLMKTLTPPNNQSLAVSDLGTIVPPSSTPAHIPVTVSADEMARVLGYNLPSTPPPRAGGS